MVRTTVASQLAALKKQREALDKEERALMAKSFDKVLSKIVQMAKDAGLTARDICQALDSGIAIKTTNNAKVTRTPKKSTLAGKKVAAKYLNPANPEQTWTGRGVSPDWVQKLKAAATLDTTLFAHNTTV